MKCIRLKSILSATLFMLFTQNAFAFDTTNSNAEYIAAKGECGGDQLEVYFSPVQRVIGTVQCGAVEVQEGKTFAIQSLNYGTVGKVRAVVIHKDGTRSESVSDLSAFAMNGQSGEVQRNEVPSNTWKTFPLSAKTRKGEFQFYARAEDWKSEAGIVVSLALVEKTDRLTALGGDRYALDQLNWANAKWSFGCSPGPLGLAGRSP